MVTAAYVRMMSAYNSELNRRLFAAAACLEDAQRRADGGAFWGSLHGTLAHLLWADRMWMSRLAGWAKPTERLPESASSEADFPTLAQRRVALDADIEDWSLGVTTLWLEGDLVWFSGAAQRQITMPRGKIVVHLFNHQTHHRGQAHALLTRAGASVGDTDLFLVIV